MRKKISGNVAVVDTETTGAGEEDQVCEIGIVSLQSDDWAEHISEVEQFHSLIRPTCPMTPEGRAAHHITDAMLADAPTMLELFAWKNMMRFIAAEYFVAHNVAFDQRLIEQSDVSLVYHPSKTICTWRCSMHHWPDAPSHSNQVLRYWLELDVEKKLAATGLAPHRALYDAIVTAALFQRLCWDFDLPSLVKITQEPLLLKKVRFGKYRGMEWSDLAKADRGYLHWILRQDFDADVKHTVNYYLKGGGK